MSSQTLHHALLRPAIIHILRASGFHSTRPSVLDTLTDLCARYLMLLASRTAQFAHNRTSVIGPLDKGHAEEFPTPHFHVDSTPSLAFLDGTTPTISDIRMALTSASCFTSSLTATEEAWHETLRKPLSALPAAAQEKERRRRDAEDTKDVRELIDWITGPTHGEIRRIAGLLVDESPGGVPGVNASSAGGPPLRELSRAEREDYLAVLRKKHSKTGDGARYAGTALGKGGEDKGPTRIEGGLVSMREFNLKKRHFDDVDASSMIGRDYAAEVKIGR